MPNLFQRNALSICVILLVLISHSPAQENGSDDKAPVAAEANEVHGTRDSVSQVAEPSRGAVHIVAVRAPGNPARIQRIQKITASNSIDGPAVQYWGGPVISNVQVVEVLWGNFVNGATSGLGQFFTDVTQSNYFSLLAEYDTVGLNGLGTGNPTGTNQVIGPGTFAQSVTINPSLCPGGSSNPPCSITDDQIQTEITSQLNGGHLPAPATDPASGTFNTLYMIYFPPGVSISLQGIDSCVFGGFCAYHSNVAGGSLQVPYGVFPDLNQGACAGGCGGGTLFQNLTAVSSHELAEAVTDVDAGSAPNFAPPLGWDDQGTGFEIGDFCNAEDTQITVNGNNYTVQTLASNMQTLPNQPPACVSAPAHFVVQPSSISAVPGTPVQMVVSAESSMQTLTLSSYSNTVHFTSTDSSAALPADYTYVPGSDNGIHTFTLTFNSTGSQTVTVSDKQVTAMTGQASADVEHNPDLTIKSVHNGSFTQSQTGATYTLTAANIGDLPTNSSVTVTDSLGSGLIPVAMSGTGWTCSMATGSCTTTNILAAGASYPPITLTVNVANNAPPIVVPVATVSGGGEINTTNDSAKDPTNIIQLPDLIVSSVHSGVVQQGENGLQYTLTVTNTGAGPTTNTVTVTDSLASGLTATSMSGQTWACTVSTLTCTTTQVESAGFQYPAITLLVNVALNAPSSVTNTVTVSGGGELNTSNDQGTDTASVLPAIAFPNPTSSASTISGGMALYPLTVSATTPGAISLGCSSGLPSGASCSFSPPSLTGPISQQINLSIGTTSNAGASFAVGGSKQDSRPLMLYLLCGLAALDVLRRSMRAARWRPVTLAAGLLGLMLLMSCGGSGNPTPIQKGTPAGTYVVTVTATNAADNIQGNVQITLIVN